MQTLAHFQYGWLIANTDEHFTLTERRVIALAALVPDIDSIAQLFGANAFYKYHHIVLHNFSFLFIYFLLAIFFSRRVKYLAFVSLSFLSHLATDYITSDWPLQLLYPFSKTEITLENYLSSEIIIKVLQPIFAYSIIIATVFILIKYHRTFIEVFHKNADKIIVNFLILPWKNKCSECESPALYQCSECKKTLCSRHRLFGKNLKVLCDKCRARDSNK